MKKIVKLTLLALILTVLATSLSSCGESASDVNRGVYYVYTDGEIHHEDSIVLEERTWSYAGNLGEYEITDSTIVLKLNGGVYKTGTISNSTLIFTDGGETVLYTKEATTTSWLDGLYKIVAQILIWFNDITGSYALALFLYAVLFKILFIPFGIKTQKNQIAMAKLRPKLAKIEKKYAGRTDRVTMEKKQKEIMDLQQAEGYSPLSGCLPLLLQMPLIIFLYNIIQKPLSYICGWSAETVNAVAALTGGNALRQIEMIDTIFGKQDIVAAVLGVAEVKLPNFIVLGVNLAKTPSLKEFSILVLIPILAAGSQWLSMWLTRKWGGNVAQEQAAADPQSQMSMKMMDFMMPLMTLFFAFNFSGMLGLYWVYQTAISILQQYILCKAMPMPHFTEEEIREMERAEKAKAKAQRAAATSADAPRFKSLHHIDDDDYDTLPEPESKPKAPSAGKLGIDAGELKDPRNQ